MAANQPQIHGERLEQLKLKPRRLGKLKAFCEQLAEILGNDLVSLYVFGDAVRGDWDPASDDINVLVVQQRVDFNELQRIGGTVAEAQRQARVATLFMTYAEVLESSDVYSLRFDDLKRHNLHVAGEELFSGLQIASEQLRFVCELELRNIVLKLRNFYLRSYLQPKLEQKTLMTLFRSVTLPLRTLHRLLDLAEASTTQATLEGLSESLGVTTTTFMTQLPVLSRGGRLNQHDLAQSYSEFNQLILHAVERVDRLELD